MKHETFTLVNAHIIEPLSNSEGLGSLTVEDGKIASLDGGSKGTEIDCFGKCLAPGIVDLGVKICEPGERHKESFRSAGASAIAGGITTLITRPDTAPTIDTPEILEFFLRRAKDATKVKIVPMAALSKNLKGTELTEMNLLQDIGAIAFTNAFNYIDSNKNFLLALQYAKDLGALVVGHPQDNSFSENSSATSGLFASKQGIPSVPPLAEKLGIDRDLTLVGATNIRYHADQITTEDSLKSLQIAKSAGLKVTAGTSIHHLTLNELDIASYKTFFKICPPLRSEEDRLATVQGVIDGNIDTISSFHTPQDEESKRLPFEIAASGAVGLQTLLPAALQLVHNNFLTLPKLFKSLSLNPSIITGIPSGTLNIGASADMVLFDKDAPFIMDRFKLLSKSKNTPFDERKMQGKVIKTFIDGISV